MTFRPSYPSIASTLALVVALGSGGAYAAGLAKNSVKSKQIKNSAVKTVDLKNDAATGAKVLESSLAKVPAAAAADSASNVLRASVQADGTLVTARSKSAVSSSVTSDGAGTYEVIFDRPLAGCTYSATVASSTTLAPLTAFIHITSRGGGTPTAANGVYVQTRDSTAALSPRSFMVIVVC